MNALNVDELLSSQSLILCGGTGGVGKTTTAAALGMRAAQLGRRTLVLTIDPAKRLAQAMGLSGLTTQAVEVPGQPNLNIMMLDPGDTLDDVIMGYMDSEQQAQEVLNSPYYQQISQTVAGSREFMAMQKISELTTSREYALIIVDTPPSQHALDFIDAPKRLIEMLDGSGLGILLRANNLANRMSFGLLGRSQQQFAKLFEQLTGHRLMLDINAFYASFGDILTTFKQRARDLQNLLRGPNTSFVLIAAAEPALEVITAYNKRMQQEHIDLAGVVFNQVVPTFTPVDEFTLALSSDPIVVCYRRWKEVGAKQQGCIERCVEATGLSSVQVPRLTQNVSTTADLNDIVAALSGTG